MGQTQLRTGRAAVPVPVQRSASDDALPFETRRSNALDRIFKLLHPPGDLAKDVPPGAMVLWDPPDASGAMPTALLVGARAEVARNAPVEGVELRQLSPDAQVTYSRLTELTQASPLGRLALQDLLLKGTFEQCAQPLKALVDRKLATGVDRRELASALLRELSTPSCIDQKLRGTCAATSASIALASHDPAEYARLVVDLCSTDSTRLKNGDVISPFIGPRQEYDGGRSISQRMLIPALMEYANGDEPYRDEQSTHGLMRMETERLMGGLFGGDAELITEATGLKQSSARLVREACERREPMLASLPYGGQTSHMVNVSHIIPNERGDYVAYFNPWGREEAMPLEEFARQVDSLIHARTP